MDESPSEYFVNTGGPCLMLFEQLGGRRRQQAPDAVLENLTRVTAIEHSTYKWRGFTRWMLVKVIDQPIMGWVAAMFLTPVESK